ncbi:MAG: hypothetical protein JF588_21805 [Caulobacterales bacterium]|nr:hypothetical protein [Caulobacterales bacterium]
MADHSVFWWLLALVGVFVLVFAVGLAAKLSRREHEARQGEANRRDIRKPPTD